MCYLENLRAVVYETIILSHSQVCYTIWFFPIKTHLLKSSLKLDKGSVEQPFHDVIRLDKTNEMLQMCFFFHIYFPEYLILLS